MRCERNGVVVYHPYERPDEEPISEVKNGINIINVDRMMDIDTSNIDFIVRGDRYRCPKCGCEIVCGFGQRMLDYEVPQEELKRMILNAPEAIEILRK